MAKKPTPKKEEPKQPEPSKTVWGALLKKGAETAKKNPGAAAAAGAFILVGGWIPAAVAGALASEPVRKKIGEALPEGVKDGVKGAFQQGVEGMKQLRNEIENLSGHGAGETPEEPEAEDKPAETGKPKRKPGGGFKLD